MAAQPEELRRREARERAVAGQRDQPVEADALLDLGALGAGALVVPEDRRAGSRVAALVEGDEPVHLAREPDRPLGQPRAHGLRGAPPVLGILLRPARLRRRERVALRLGDARRRRRDRDALDAGRADVEPDASFDVRELDHVPERVAAREARRPSSGVGSRLDARCSSRRSLEVVDDEAEVRLVAGLVHEHQMQLEVAADAEPDEPGRVELRQTSRSSSPSSPP